MEIFLLTSISESIYSTSPWIDRYTDRQSGYVLTSKSVAEGLITGETGRKKIIEASKICKDDTYEILNKLISHAKDESSVLFVYHKTNACYMDYAHSGKLCKIKAKQETEENYTPEQKRNEEEKPAKLLRKDVTPCSPPSSGINPKYIKCLLCTFVSHHQIDKFRLCEYDSIKKVISTAKSKQDHVFTKIADRLR